ncbi:MAG TPA: DUF1667 domain-containing protein [Feifaniaceae bacterium]|nr:DUF1667 domain-containing protein [Feifaniaceae bacterium]
MRDTIQLSEKEIVCIVCPNGCRIRCTPKEDGYAFSGNKCKRGVAYAEAELTRPMRSLTSSVKTVFPDSPVVSVRTDGEIEKSRIPDVLTALGKVTLDHPVEMGDVIIPNVCNTGVNMICTSNRLVHRP